MLIETITKTGKAYEEVPIEYITSIVVGADGSGKIWWNKNGSGAGSGFHSHDVSTQEAERIVKVLQSRDYRKSERSASDT